MKNGHEACENYLVYCHAPSGGGVYHRAALTIQAVWRYHRYKVSLFISTVIIENMNLSYQFISIIF